MFLRGKLHMFCFVAGLFKFIYESYLYPDLGVIEHLEQCFAFVWVNQIGFFNI